MEVTGLVTKNAFFFPYVTLFLKDISNSKHFYKGFFLSVIPLRIIALSKTPKQAKHRKLCGHFAFPPDFHTRIFAKISVFYSP